MQTMRNLWAVFAALAVMLGIVSGNLWYELRSSRQQVAALQDQLDQAGVPGARLAKVLPPSIQGPAAPPATTQLPQPLPAPPMVPRAAAAPRPVVSASVTQPLIGGTEQERRADALVQSDRTATARVRAWSTVLNLKPEQLQALNEAAMAELRRETEESLEIDRRSGPVNAQVAAQLKVDTVNRQHETNLRILERMTPQLTPEQSTRMRTIFDGWIRTNLARAQQEQAAISGN